MLCALDFALAPLALARDAERGEDDDEERLNENKVSENRTRLEINVLDGVR